MTSRCFAKPGGMGGQRLVVALCALSYFAIFSAPRALGQRSSYPAREIRWHAMGASPCIWPTDETGRNVDGQIRILRANGFSCYVALLWGEGKSKEAGRQAMDLSSLEKILPAFNSARISVWVVLIPPSEGGNSEPYGADYLRWMQELAKLSLKYPYLRGVNIDDFQDGINRKTFTPDHTCMMYRAKQRINPKLQFAPTLYDLDRTFADQYGGCIDGVWLWWVNLENNSGLRSFLENSRLAVAGRFPIYGGVYAHRTSWHMEGDPSAAVLKRALDITCACSDGAIIWELALTDNSVNNPLLETARLFGQRGTSPLAGKCGMSFTQTAAKSSAPRQ